MSDDLNKKIMQIADILGKEGMPENVKGLLSLLGNTAGGNEPQSKASEAPAKENEYHESKEEKSTRSETDENMEMVRRIKHVMDAVTNNNDPRINLLNSIRPFLNTKRQKRLSNCIKLLQMSSLAKLFDENDKNGF